MDKLIFSVFFVFFTLGDCVLGTRRGSSQCGIPLAQEKIIGGIDSGGYRYPWFALLLLKKSSYLPIPICAGSLISSFHVLTAAHCFTISVSTQYRNLFSVALGVYDICNDAETTREIFNMENVAIHENYQRKGKFYDIALIKLDRPARYTFICLPLLGYKRVPDVTELAVLIGFGMTEESSDFVPCHMLEVNVTKYSKKDCSLSKLPPEDKNEPSVICAGTFTGEVDSCYGDSGGPLQTISSDGRYSIAGIVSYGYGCATPDVPGIYTNVGSYLQWIHDKISSFGSKETNTTKKQNTDFLFNTRPKKTHRIFQSSVFSPERRTTSQKPENEKSPIYIKYPDPRRTTTFNNSIFYSYEQKRKNNHSSTSKKGSSVTFPE